MRYCKKCGHEIDEKTKKCTGCGKQYANIFCVLLAVVYAVLLLSSVYFYNQCQLIAKTCMQQIDIIDSEFTARFGHLQNPKTGENITGYQSYLDALDAQMEMAGDSYE